MYNLTESEIVHWTNEINGVHNIDELHKVALSAKRINHPYIHQLIGFNYFVRNEKESARVHLLECVKLCLDNYSTIKNTFFIDSLGSSLFALIRIDKNKLIANNNLWLKYFTTSYYSLSLAINNLDIAFDTYRNRAILLEDNEDILPMFIIKHIGIGTTPEELIISDFYSSHRDAIIVGATGLSNMNLNNVQKILDNSGNLNIMGKDLDEWNLAKLNTLIEQKHAQVFKSLTKEYHNVYHLNKNDLIL